jgi:hypothetical protein
VNIVRSRREECVELNVYGCALFICYLFLIYKNFYQSATGNNESYESQLAWSYLHRKLWTIGV